MREGHGVLLEIGSVNGDGAQNPWTSSGNAATRIGTTTRGVTTRVLHMEARNRAYLHFWLIPAPGRPRCESTRRRGVFRGRIQGSYYSACHWQGTLVTGSVATRVVLFDNPTDGDCINDALVVDLTDDGKAQPDEFFRVTDPLPFMVEETILEALSPSGNWFRLAHR